jgi:hypothetical protein
VSQSDDQGETKNRAEAAAYDPWRTFETIEEAALYGYPSMRRAYVERVVMHAPDEAGVHVEMHPSHPDTVWCERQPDGRWARVGNSGVGNPVHYSFRDFPGFWNYDD